MTQYAIDRHSIASANPINSLGEVHSTVQGAIDGVEADGNGGWIYVPPGTWSEALTIQDADIELFGAGWSSIIDGGTTGHAIDINGDGDRVSVRDLQVKTTPGGGNSYNGIISTGDDTIIQNVFVNGSDNYGIYAGNRGKVLYCYVYDSDGIGIICGYHWNTIIGCYVHQTGSDGIHVGGGADNALIRGNIVYDTGGDGIEMAAGSDDCVVDGNRVIGEAITDNGGSNTVGDNDTT